VELAKTVTDWQTEHPHIDPIIRHELDLVRVALEERFESQDRKMLMLDQALHREREAANCDAEKLSAMEADVFRLRWLLGETVASVQTAARNIDLLTAAAAEQRLAYGRNTCALEEEMGRARETFAWQGDELAETRRRRSEPGGLVQQLEGEIQLLWESSDGLKGHLAGVEAEQRTEGARLQEAMTAG
jgi:chromosome segregation ATPase